MMPRSIEPIMPGPGQESAWAYPRPPRVECCQRHVVVVFAGEVVADTTRALRVVETSHPPVYYVPPGDYLRACFRPTADESFCEFKGVARYFDLAVGERIARHAAWSYPSPAARYAVLQDCMAVYPGRVDACYVDGERVQAQDGHFYGGWITRDVVGPFKGGPGTRGW
jgi:uncharacterized protein (DUF427 family)